MKIPASLFALGLLFSMVAARGQGGEWKALSSAPAARDMMDAACDLKGKIRYSLYSTRRKPLTLVKTGFDGTRTELGSHALLKSELITRELAFDPVKREVLVFGPGAKQADLGWTVVLAYNPGSKQWRRLEFGDAGARKAHAARCGALESLRDLVGRTRAYWYRDNSNKGTDAERKDLTERCTKLQSAPELAKQVEGLKAYAGLVAGQKLLDALKQLRKVENAFDAQVESLSPVPPARLRSPVAVDSGNKVMVLFGGDHEDYLMNDTWILDLTTRIWKRANPAKSPAARGGHAMGYLPKSGLVVMLDGYLQTNSSQYRSKQWKMVPDRGAWLYDVKKNEWEYAALSGKAPSYRGFVNDYGRFTARDLRTGAGDQLFVRLAGDSKKKTPDKYWSAGLNASAASESGAALVAPNTRIYRTGIFTAAHYEVPDPGTPVDLEKLPVNVWTKLPGPPRLVHRGQRQKDWSCATWDAERDQILHWGGGHCDGAYSAVTHWSPQSGRMVEGYDAEEQYGHQGGGISFIGRAKVPTHSYRSYAYDPKRRAVVTLKGNRTYLYDTLRMDWNKRIDKKVPFVVHCYTVILATTPHGVVCWAGKPGAYMGGPRGLWILDSNDAWKQLVKPGGLPNTMVDGSAAMYDSKRDCLWFGTNGGYGKAGDGRVHRYDFKSGKVTALTPENIKIGKIYFWRETAYVDHCDWLLSLSPYRKNRKDKNSPAYSRVYDCAKNKWMLVDHGPNTGKVAGASQGVVYDPKRKLVYSITNGGALWVLKIDPAKAKVVEVK